MSVIALEHVSSVAAGTRVFDAIDLTIAPAERVAVVAVVALRIAGFAAVSAAARSPGAVAAVDAVPLLAIGLSSLVIFHGPAVRAFNARIAGALRGLAPGRRLARG